VKGLVLRSSTTHTPVRDRSLPGKGVDWGKKGSKHKKRRES